MNIPLNSDPWTILADLGMKLRGYKWKGWGDVVDTISELYPGGDDDLHQLVHRLDSQARKSGAGPEDDEAWKKTHIAVLLYMRSCPGIRSWEDGS